MSLPEGEQKTRATNHCASFAEHLKQRCYGSCMNQRAMAFPTAEVKLFIMGQCLEDDFVPLFHVRGIYEPWHVKAVSFGARATLGNELAVTCNKSKNIPESRVVFQLISR